MRFLFTPLVGLLLLPFSLLAATEGTLDEGLVNPGFYSKPGWFKESFLDLPEDIADANDQDKRLLLLFHQDGCPYCEKLLKENFQHPEIVKKTQQLYDVVEINMWGDREVVGFNGETFTEKSLAKQFRVQYTPTLLFIDNQANVEFRANGYYPPQKFINLLDYLGSNIDRTTTSFHQFIQTAQPRQISQAPNTLPKPLNLKRVAGMRPLAVIFEQGNCEVCSEYHSFFKSDAELTKELLNFDIAQVDINSDKRITTPDGKTVSASDWAGQLNINYTPSIVFFDDKNNRVFAAEAYLRPFHLKGIFSYISSGAYQSQPEFQRYVQGLADQLRGQGKAVDLWN